MDNTKQTLSLRELADTLGWYDPQMDASGINSFGKYDPTSFSQVVRLMGPNQTISITPAECDYALSCLLRDVCLQREIPSIWRAFATHLCQAMKLILEDEPSTPETSTREGDYCRGEYTRFMQERETLRKRNQECHETVAAYNNIVIDWRFGKVK